ncbi:hypothetical protein PEL8287_01734 [Roseovarius litorisediminis]|uniref:Chitin-binding type-2 domain-containing protein n=1 Tax=Roseovarius litorisediminis TaxID=1312363 RepID=A0A1Y5SAY7_9RHOB|nr:hypothetical protein [Roseovarius litorisediminis]SLN36537.1 hypothetical protein PEL8287_01734 [Roseovarius litorisediminis]
MAKKLTLAVVAMMLLPAAGLAGSGCHLSDHKQAISCAEGSIWDGETGTCLPKTTS